MGNTVSTKLTKVSGFSLVTELLLQTHAHWGPEEGPSWVFCTNDFLYLCCGPSFEMSSKPSKKKKKGCAW